VTAAAGWRIAIALTAADLLAPARARAQVQAPARVTLPEAVQRALARNPSVAVALAELERADALVKQARSGAYPTLIGNGSYTRLDSQRALVTPANPMTGAPASERVISAKDQISANLQLTVPLVAPQAWAQVWHAGDNLHVTEAAVADVRRQIAVAVARAYLAVVAQHRIVSANENARTTAKAHFDYAHTRLVGGIGHSIDEVRAEQELRTDEVAVQAAYTGLARAREALGVLMATDGPIDSVNDDVALDATPDLPAALRAARTDRVDIKTLERRLAATQSLVKDEWVAYAPFLSAVGQPFYQVGSGLQPTSGWQAQLILTLPIYDGGLRIGVARERDALIVEARASLESTLRQAQSDVRTAFESMVRADQGLVAARDAARLAARALELANVAYHAGATTNLEVIDASRGVRIADTSAAQAEDVARQARLDLLVGSGRFP
jgi:outer membrane protein TolC